MADSPPGKRQRRTLLVGIGMVAACVSTEPSPHTGLTGVVMRGPVTPVCRVDVPCDAPFSAAFGVEQGGRRVAEFTSDGAGQFSVLLAPGAYTVVPDAGAPIIAPTSQKKSVTVADIGALTTVRLMFDTGIR
jgi:hypothetical protein